MERSEALQALGLTEYNVYSTFSDGPVWTGLASSPIHALDRYSQSYEYNGYTRSVELSELSDQQPLHEYMSVIGDTVWMVFENTEVYAAPASEPRPEAPTDSPTDPATVASIVHEAQDAFWSVVCAHFPSADTGDLDPNTTNNWEFAAESTVKAWIDANVKRHYVAVVFDVTGMPDDAQAHLAMQAAVQGESDEHHGEAQSCTIQTTTGGTMDDFLDNLPEGWGEF